VCYFSFSAAKGVINRSVWMDVESLKRLAENPKSIRAARVEQQLLLYDLKGSRRYTEITELTPRLWTHSRRLIHEFSLATATGTFCNCELP